VSRHLACMPDSKAGVQGCILYDNWWPMLTAFLYVFVPMPYLFFGAGAGDSLYSNDMEIGFALWPRLRRNAVTSMLPCYYVGRCYYAPYTTFSNQLCSVACA
jgi:Vacuolar protein sorting 55